MARLPLPFWEEMIRFDLLSADPAQWIAVLPLAAIEQHGPHLPLATDSIIAEGLIRETVRLLPADLAVTFLPVQRIGASSEHGNVPGTLSLCMETLHRLLMEIGADIARTGLRKLVIITSHGGNIPAMDTAIRTLRIKHDMLAIGTSWTRLGMPDDLFPERERLYGVHGGAIETSLMLALRPDLVRMERATDFPSLQEKMAREMTHLRVHGPVQFGWLAEDLNPAGVVGDASAASAEKGRYLLAETAKRFIALLRDVERFALEQLASLSRV